MENVVFVLVNIRVKAAVVSLDVQFAKNKILPHWMGLMNHEKAKDAS